MASTFWQKTDDGIELIDTSSIKEQVEEVFLEAFPNLNTDESTPQGQIITFLAEKFSQAQSDITSFANSMFNGGSGVWLDSWAKTMFGITRKSASNGSVTALITGVKNTIIPVGFTADNGDYKFSTKSQYKIGSDGTCYAELFAEDSGSFTIEPETLTEVVSEVSGVERITNPYESSPGVDEETDSELRVRALNSLRYRSTSIFDGLLAQILQIDGVVKLGGYENATTSVVEYKGISFQQHSIGIVVKGGDLNEIGAVILANKTVGAYVQGDIEIEVTDETSGKSSTMRIYRPTPVEFKAYIVVKIDTQTSQDYEEQLKEQLINAIDDLDIGADVIFYDIANKLSLDHLQVVDFGISPLNGDYGGRVIDMGFVYEATISADNITVSVYE